MWRGIHRNRDDSKETASQKSSPHPPAWVMMTHKGCAFGALCTSYRQAAQQMPGTSPQLDFLESPLEWLTMSMALGWGGGAYYKSCKLLLSQTGKFVYFLPFSLLEQMLEFGDSCPAVVFQDCYKGWRFSVELETSSKGMSMNVLFSVHFEVSLQSVFFPRLCAHTSFAK